MSSFCKIVILVLIATFNTKVFGRALDLNDEEDDYEEEAKKNEAGVLDIIGGAFEGNFNKIIGGAFSFTDKNVRETLVPVITGEKPKKTEKPVGATVSSISTNKEEDEDSE